jgi:hypothetical protein
MKRPTPSKWVNAKGQRAHHSLTPPDTKQCQAFPNVLNWGPFALGPRPTPIRCENKALFVLVENKAVNDDGKIGSMSLCNDCLILHRKYRPPTFAKVHEI